MLAAVWACTACGSADAPRAAGSTSGGPAYPAQPPVAGTRSSAVTATPALAGAGAAAARGTAGSLARGVAGGSLAAEGGADARLGGAEHKKFVEAEINKWGPAIKAAGQYAD